MDTSKTLEEVLQEIEDNWDGTTSPGSFYSEAGQVRFWYTESVPYYAEYLDNFVAVYRALDDNRIIGGAVFNNC